MCPRLLNRQRSCHHYKVLLIILSLFHISFQFEPLSPLIQLLSHLLSEQILNTFSFDFASIQCLFLLRSITSLSSSIVLSTWLRFKIKLVLGWPANLLFMLFIFCSILMTDQANYYLTTEMKFYSQSL